MDVTELLQQDHRKVEGLFDQYKSTQDDATVEQICQELEGHTTVEEEIVYPGSPRSTRTSSSMPRKSTPPRRTSLPDFGHALMTSPGWSSNSKPRCNTTWTKRRRKRSPQCGNNSMANLKASAPQSRNANRN
jgi:hypothetical protein